MVDFKDIEETRHAADIPRVEGSRTKAAEKLFSEIWGEWSNLSKPRRPGLDNPGWRARVIASMGSPDFDVRERASQHLVQAGPLALGVLGEAVRHPDLQIRRTAEQILAARVDRSFPVNPSVGEWIKMLESEPTVHLPAVPRAFQLATRGTSEDIRRTKQELRALTETVIGARDRNWLAHQQHNLGHWNKLLSSNLREVGQEVNQVTSLTIPADRAPLSAENFIAGMRAFAQLARLGLRDCKWINDTTLDKFLDNHPNLQDLDVSGTRISGDSLKRIAGLHYLRRLDLNRCSQISDEEIANFAAKLNSDGLKVLSLSGTRASDQTLKSFANHAKNLRNLWSLDLSSTTISDNGMEHLRQLPNIASLNLANTKIGDRAVNVLNKATNLNDLDLSNTGITEQGLKRLGVGELTILNLQGTDVTDVTSITAKKFPKLRSLSLQGTKVDDAQLQHLAEFKALESIDLRGTRVTAQGIAALRQLKPLAKIASDF
ncbi:MAG: hypothetical protein C5B53_00090 [Candidatus Melainabacteria bacterium]|nr:MAG: hypothetical protein C5B53_00090 [Candidatus Melainabacteria bacterium]